MSSLSAPLVASINDVSKRCFSAALNVVSALKASVKVLCISPDGPTPPVPPTDQMWWLWDSGVELMWDNNVNVIYE